MDLTPEELAYMAGFVDGEGCLTYGRTRTSFYPRVLVVNTNKEVLEFFKERIGGHIYKQVGKKAEWKQAWEWRICWKAAIEFAKVLSPYLKVKYRQAQIFIAWGCISPGTIKKPRDEAKSIRDGVLLIVEELKWLNKRGSADKGEEPIYRVIREGGLEYAIETGII